MKIIKKTKILKIINPKQINNNNQTYTASIIIPHIDISLNLRSKDILKKMLTQLLIKPKRILKKHEDRLLFYAKTNPYIKNYHVKRDFSLLVEDLSVKISDFSLCEINYIEELEKQNLQIYLNDYIKKIESIKSKSSYSYLIFNYIISDIE